MCVLPVTVTTLIDVLAGASPGSGVILQDGPVLQDPASRSRQQSSRCRRARMLRAFNMSHWNELYRRFTQQCRALAQLPTARQPGHYQSSLAALREIHRIGERYQERALRYNDACGSLILAAQSREGAIVPAAGKAVAHENAAALDLFERHELRELYNAMKRVSELHAALRDHRDTGPIADRILEGESTVKAANRIYHDLTNVLDESLRLAPLVATHSQRALPEVSSNRLLAQYRPNSQLLAPASAQHRPLNSAQVIALPHSPELPGPKLGRRR